MARASSIPDDAAAQHAEHGSAAGVDLAAWLGDDPALALVTAEAQAWEAAHPCDCEALCRCEA